MNTEQFNIKIDASYFGKYEDVGALADTIKEILERNNIWLKKVIIQIRPYAIEEYSWNFSGIRSPVDYEDYYTVRRNTTAGKPP